MSVVASDLQLWSAASIAEDDTSTTGGAISTVSRPELTQFTATAALVVVSDGTDTRTGTAVFRLADGTKVTQAFTLNGTTEVVVAGGNAERVERVTLGSTSGTRTVSIKQGAGGTVRGTILPNETERRILFIDATSEAAGTSRFEKLFFKNANGVNALLNAVLKLTADPAGKIKQGITASKGDSSSIANRKTTPAGVTFVDDNVGQNVPGTNLGVAENIGFWVELDLTANDAPLKTTATFEMSGSTT